MTLVPGAIARGSAGEKLSSRGHEIPQDVDGFIIHFEDFFGAELTNFAPGRAHASAAASTASAAAIARVAVSAGTG